jgi:hypothetical protein
VARRRAADSASIGELVYPGVVGYQQVAGGNWGVLAIVRKKMFG